MSQQNQSDSKIVPKVATEEAAQKSSDNTSVNSSQLKYGSLMKSKNSFKNRLSSYLRYKAKMLAVISPVKDEDKQEGESEPVEK